MPRQATQIWSQNDQNRRIYIYIEYYEERKNLKVGSELAKKNKLKKKKAKPVQLSHATSSPGSGCGFCLLYFRQINKVSKQLILWF